MSCYKREGEGGGGGGTYQRHGPIGGVLERSVSQFSFVSVVVHRANRQLPW